MYVCIPTYARCPKGSEVGVRFPGIQLRNGCKTTMWMLGLQHRSSGRVVSAPNG